ncbi:MAG: serine hydrolase domain-containing protein [Bacteroidales bacterium]
MKKLFFTLLLVFIVSISFSQNLKKELDSLMFKSVNEGQLHGCVTYVQQRDKVLHFESYGFKNIEQNKKMENDVIFRIASMTKIITAAGALKLYEEGKFLLDEPVKKYIPQFNNLKVMQNIGTDSCKIVNLERDITIRDLFRHTAGFGSGGENDTIGNLYNKLDSAKTSEDFLNTISQIPLRNQPGSKWEYSCSNKILGFLIEKIINKTLHDYLTESFFVPLGMTNTGFYVAKKNIDKLSCSYIYDEGKLKLEDNPMTSEYLKVPTIYNGGGGIVSTAKDLANFYNMILHYGTFNGKQILKAQTVELLISNQIGEIKDRGIPDLTNILSKYRSFSVAGYGFGVGIHTEKNSGKTQSIYWAGSYNTYFLIDYDKQLITIFLTQITPFMHLDIMNKFGQIVNKNVH